MMQENRLHQFAPELREVPANSPLEMVVQRWSRYCHLTSEDRAALCALRFTLRTFQRDEYMVREGDIAKECAVILRGFAYRQKIGGDGQRQILSFHIPGEFVDLQNTMLGVADHSVQCVNGCEAAIISRSALIQIADQYPRLRAAMWIDTLLEASIFREWLLNVGRRDARTRIAHLLCELAFRMTELNGTRDGPFRLPLTQEQLADATGLTAVHTNRTLQALRREGLIQLSSGSLAILDWERLREVGDFDELYLHRHI